MKTALVTGVAGFLGGHVAHRLKAGGYRVLGTDTASRENAPLDTLDAYVPFSLPDAGFSKWAGAEMPDFVVHCAGRASVWHSIKSPGQDFAGNVIVTQGVLETLRSKLPDSSFLLLSSAAVYGNPPGLPVSEEAHPAPISPYGFHKRQAELLCEEYASVFGLRTASLRIFSAYGAGLRRQVMWDLSRKVLGSGELEVIGTGEESRDFIHARDIAEAVALTIESAAFEGEVYNLASGVETKISDLVAMLLDVFGSGKKPVFSQQRRDGDPVRWLADVSRLKALGFAPVVSLREGLEDYAKWAAPLLRS